MPRATSVTSASTSSQSPGYFIDKTDFKGEEGVGSVFNHLGTVRIRLSSWVGDDKRTVSENHLAGQRFVRESVDRGGAAYQRLRRCSLRRQSDQDRARLATPIPSCKNSGFEATEIFPRIPRSEKTSSTTSATRWLVPIGTVDLTTSV